MAGTLVTTKEGLKPIEEVKIGEYVLSRSEESGETSYKKVTDTLIRSTYNICTIELENGKIKSTTGHLFMVQDKWWKAAAELKAGDILETADGKCKVVKSITVEEKGYPVTTYNLSVEDNHTFFVGKLGVLTHNMKGFTPCELADEVAEKATKGVSKPKPYSKNRPSYRKGQVDEVWENAKDPLTGKVYDPTGKEITWDKTKPRNGQWDMGHIPGEKYSEMHKLYMDGTITKKEFLEWYKNPKNYRPELPSTNRSHKYE